MNQEREDLGVGAQVETIERPPKLAPRYTVIMLNDDVTPMGFVVEILKLVFGMSEERAERVMLAVHTKGSAVCGVYSLQIAETKLAEVFAAAERADYPLQCTLEPVEDEDES